MASAGPEVRHTTDIRQSRLFRRGVAAVDRRVRSRSRKAAASNASRRRRNGVWTRRRYEWRAVLPCGGAGGGRLRAEAAAKDSGGKAWDARRRGRQEAVATEKAAVARAEAAAKEAEAGYRTGESQEGHQMSENNTQLPRHRQAVLPMRRHWPG